MEYITTHWDELLLIATSVIGTASLIVKLTPTLKDDTILAKIVSVLGAIGLNPKK